MIQPRRSGESVFDNSGAPWPFFSQVSAINYDNGGQGFGYNVPTPSTGSCPAGSTYRPDAVNMKTSVAGAPAIPFQIGCNGAPNSFNYTINITQSGPYQITLQLADTATGGSENILLDGVQVATVPTPNTGSFDTFLPSASGPFSASLGIHKLTIAWGTGDSQFGSAGDMLTWQGSQAPATTINSVTMSCGGTCGFVGGTAGTVGTAQATMSSGQFNGNWSLRTSATDNAGATCKNYGSNFTINSATGVVSNAAIANGTYDGVCVVATQAGATGSPFALAVTITGSSTGIAVPNPAVAANFTTLAENYDFSQSFYATKSNWLGCYTTTWPPVGTPWYQEGPSGAVPNVPCSTINQGVDPVDGSVVLDMFFPGNLYASPTVVNQNIVTQSHGGAAVTDFPNNFYLEFVSRIPADTVAANDASPIASVWSWGSIQSGADPGGPVERDFVEEYYNGGSDMCEHNHILQSTACEWFGSGVLTHLGSYHKIGLRVTSDGSTDMVACGYIDDQLIKCVDDSAQPAQFNYRNDLIVSVGMMPVDFHYYVKYIRVWSCASWQTTQCNGPVLSGAP